MVLSSSAVAPDIVGLATPSTDVVVVTQQPTLTTPPASNHNRSGKSSHKSNKSGREKEKTDLQSMFNRSSKGVLKPQTSFSGIKIGAEAAEGPKRLTFADEHGEMLVLNVFVDQLHYGENQLSLNNIGSEPTQKCCIIS